MKQQTGLFIARAALALGLGFGLGRLLAELYTARKTVRDLQQALLRAERQRRDALQTLPNESDARFRRMNARIAEMRQAMQDLNIQIELREAGVKLREDTLQQVEAQHQASIRLIGKRLTHALREKARLQAQLDAADVHN